MGMTRTEAITLRGTPTGLAGPELKIGDAAPDFILQSNALKLQNNALEGVLHDSFEKNILLLVTVPSLNTPVRHTEIKKFHQHALDLANVEVLVVSTDLPFGQKRGCRSEGAKNEYRDNRIIRSAECLC
jgi:thiol peroxidase